MRWGLGDALLVLEGDAVPPGEGPRGAVELGDGGGAARAHAAELGVGGVVEVAAEHFCALADVCGYGLCGGGGGG